MDIARKRFKPFLPTGKLLPVMAIFLSVTIASLSLTYVALAIQSTMRAFVNGEALWSKAQRDAVLFLDLYATTGNARHLTAFEDALAVIMGDRRARLELEKPDYSYDVVMEGFLSGGNHPADVPSVARLFRCCSDFGYLARAIDVWEQADDNVLKLKTLGDGLRDEIVSTQPSRERISDIRREIHQLSDDLRPMEIAFSHTLGEAARWLNRVLLWAITAIVVGLIVLGAYLSNRILNRIWQSEAKYRALLNTANDALIIVDQKSGRMLESNRRAEQITGLPAQEIFNTLYLDLFPQAQRPAARLSQAGIDDDQSAGVTRLDIKHLDGRLIPAEVSTSTTVWENRRVNLAIVRDITERVRVEEDLRIAANALANIAEGVMITDSHKHIVSVNRAFTTITGYPASSVLGRPLAELQSDRHSEEFYKALWKAIEETGYWQGEIWSLRRNGDVYPTLLSISAVLDHHTGVANYVGVFNDISQYKDYERRLEHLAHHDALTQLPNRIYFEDIVRTALRRAHDDSHKLALLFIDLDGFKGVNDRYGHAVGDELLASVADRIKSCVRQSDAVARVGGDEFTILLDELSDANDAMLVAQKLLDVVSRPVACCGHHVTAFASIGISYFPQDGDDVQTLLSNADAAMYEAKQESRNSYRLFSPGMKAKASAKQELANALHDALEEQQFSLVYQPCLDLTTGEITSVEALIRWRHPELGDVAPAAFIPVAEDIGLIKPITEWVLHTACRQAAAWHGAGLPPVRMAVNISARHFGDLHLTQGITAILAATGWRPEWLNLEITERVMMRTGEDVEKILAELRALGVGIALDDFGTGYSSLGYLKHFLIDYLKIDRSFVSGIPDDAHDVNIAKAIIAMARSLNIGIIAEGIETEQQHAFLRAQGCQEGQGYLFSRPLPARDIEEVLRRNSVAMGQPHPARLRACAPARPALSKADRFPP